MVPLISVVVASVSVIVVVCGLIYQDKRARQSLNIDLLLKFDVRFNDESFKAVRRAAAKSIYDFRMNKNKDKVREEVFDFFETVGLLLRKYKLDKELVWSTFIEWVRGYWQAGNMYIGKEQKDDETRWQDFTYLFKELTKADQRLKKRMMDRSDEDPVLSDNAISRFLKKEMTL